MRGGTRPERPSATAKRAAACGSGDALASSVRASGEQCGSSVLCHGGERRPRGSAAWVSGLISLFFTYTHLW